MKKQSILNGRERIFLVPVALCFVLAGGRGYANPHGMTVVSGSAQSAQQGNTVQITTSQNAVLNWSSFNIAAGESTIFHQPSSTSIVFNNINNANPTSIFGSLRANGIVVLQNASGFYFGPNAFVQAGGLVVTTAAINPWSSAGGVGWSFDGPPAASPIVNYGSLQTASGGSLFLIAKQIENQGTIAAPGGTAALVAGQEVLLSQRADGLSLSAPVQLPAGSVDNQGRVVADAGQVLLQAQTVNNSGVVQANSVRQNNGVIELYASQAVQLTGSSVIQANGGADGTSSGGSIVIKSGGTFSDSVGSQITATGGANGGNGGSIEVSAPSVLSLNSIMDTGAQPGYTGGQVFLDPANITLNESGTGTVPPNGTVASTSNPGSTLTLDVNTAFENITSSQITLAATAGITLSAGTIWNLSASTGKNAGQLILESGGSITLSSGSAIQDPNDWSVTLDAGYNFTTGQVTPGTGSVSLSSTAAIQTASGNINVLAGNSVTVGNGGIVSGIANGAVMTGPGGNINVQALAGNVSCGSSAGGYAFQPAFNAAGVAYTVSPSLGGISTASGGNVTITAGGNISAFLPNNGSVLTDAGSGAFGADPGNVTLTAAGTVYGHYVLANGTGTITAENAGAGSSVLALSLIKGGWVVNATDNIVLSEVRNPNGMFNASELSGTFAPTSFVYNYDPLASVELNAGNGVTITGTSLPRVPGANEALIFPPILTINAGAGGITLKKNVNLFPSPDGTLDLTTTDGGSLTSTTGGSIINISDSQSVQWTGPNSFTSLDTTGNAVLHLNDPNPVLINISGSVSDFILDSPKAVKMYVAGNIIDSSATIINLHPSDDTIISAGGEILDHSSYVILPLPPGEAPDFNALNQLADPYLNAITHLPVPSNDDGAIPTIPNPDYNATLNNVAGSFTYDPASRTLLFSGIMQQQVEAALLQMTVPFLNAATISQIYTQSQTEAIRTLGGYDVAGPGTFQVIAPTIDLGNGGGLVSVGIAGYSALVPYTARGANLDVSVSGNLTMLSSAIESEYGGTINITCGGAIDVGSVLLPSSSNQRPLGIDSLWGGNIYVIAAGDINVDGSRIAAYDGGNVFVESLDGDINAGDGGNGSVLVSKPYVNKMGHVEELAEVIPGSGILATSFPQLVYGQTSGQVGNITVDTPHGSIEASKGGIVQLVLGPVTDNNASIYLNAGSRNSDGSVAFVGNVDASGSGVVGGHVNISATGNINGLIVASLGANLSALQNITATVLSQGGATVSAGGTVSGTIVGVGSVSVSGASDVAAAFSAGAVSASGAQSGAAVAAAPTGSSSASAAATTQQVNQSTQSNSDVAANANADDNDPLKKKKKAQLMEYEGRVTVLLPE